MPILQWKNSEAQKVIETRPRLQMGECVDWPDLSHLNTCSILALGGYQFLVFLFLNVVSALDDRGQGA